MKKVFRNVAASVAVLSFGAMLVGCSGEAKNASANDKVVIYTNGDEEAVLAMENALKGAGYEGKYILQSLGTSELGGKLIAEGDKIEADLVTMSSYFMESAQEKNDMFADLTFEAEALGEHPTYLLPVLANTGAIFVNTEVMKEHNLPMPTSIKDLTKPEYKGLLSIPNILDSSTAWLLVQAVVDEYGEVEAKEIFSKLIENCGPHLESSGSGPIKKVRAGEVAVGFGLRHQAVADKEEGLPIEFVDPTEGNYSLKEAVGVVKKDDDTVKLAMEMAEVIVDEARPELIQNYPVALYKGETVEGSYIPANEKEFSSPLTVDLLEKHQQLFKDAK